MLFAISDHEDPFKRTGRKFRVEAIGKYLLTCIDQPLGETHLSRYTDAARFVRFPQAITCHRRVPAQHQADVM